MARLFVAVPLPASVRRRAAGVQDALRERLVGARVRCVRPAQMHLTLAFLGEVDAEGCGRIRRALGGSSWPAAFELRIAGLGAFPAHGRPRVLWLGVQEGADDLRRLADEVACALEKAGFPRESRPYHPHLTLARVERGSGRHTRVIEHLHPDEAGTSEVREVVLYDSRLGSAGAEHVVVERWGLAATSRMS